MMRRANQCIVKLYEYGLFHEYICLEECKCVFIGGLPSWSTVPVADVKDGCYDTGERQLLRQLKRPFWPAISTHCSTVSVYKMVTFLSWTVLLHCFDSVIILCPEVSPWCLLTTILLRMQTWRQWPSHSAWKEVPRCLFSEILQFKCHGPHSTIVTILPITIVLWKTTLKRKHDFSEPLDMVSQTVVIDA